ncbi:STAS domain-containing protein [Actinoplanes sp. NPDC000266]
MSDDRRLRTSAHPDPPTLLLVLTGELDGQEADPLVEEFTEALTTTSPDRVDLDASGLTFLDSGGLRALLTCRKAAERAGAELSIIATSEIAHQVLTISGLLQILNVQPGAPVKGSTH